MHTNILTDEQYRNLSKKLIKSIEDRFKIVALNSLKHPKYILERDNLGPLPKRWLEYLEDTIKSR